MVGDVVRDIEAVRESIFPFASKIWFETSAQASARRGDKATDYESWLVVPAVAIVPDVA